MVENAKPSDEDLRNIAKNDLRRFAKNDLRRFVKKENVKPVDGDLRKWLIINYHT